jgi:hypothetical protein
MQPVRDLRLTNGKALLTPQVALQGLHFGQTSRGLPRQHMIRRLVWPQQLITAGAQPLPAALYLVIALTVTVNTPPTAPTAPNVTYCQGATAVPLTATGTNLLWYTVASGEQEMPLRQLHLLRRRERHLIG